MYVTSLEWLNEQYEYDQRAKVQAKLDDLDSFRIASHFLGISDIIPAKNPIDPSFYTPMVVLPLYELLLRPHLLDLRPKVEGSWRRIVYRCLASWDPSRSKPFIQATRIAYGIMIMLESIDKTVVQWAYSFSWREFVPVRFVVYFEAILQHYEHFSYRERLLETSSQFHRPPSTEFFEAMATNIRRLPQLSSAELLFDQLSLMPRFGSMLSRQFIAPLQASKILSYLLEFGKMVWTGIDRPWKLALELLEASAVQVLHPSRLVISSVSDAATMISMLIMSASDFPTEHFVPLLSLICPLLVSTFSTYPNVPSIRSCIKTICRVGFERKPALEAPIDLKKIWTSLVDSELDIELITAAMTAEADYMHHSIMDAIHDAPMPHQRIFPQRMIVNGIVSITTHHAPALVTHLLTKCCSLAILDLASPKTEMSEKHVKFTKEILLNLSLILNRCASSKEFMFDSSQIRTVISLAVYYLVSPNVSESFQLLLLKKVPHPEGSTTESLLTVANPAVAAQGVRAMLWDLVLYRYRSCLGTLVSIADWTSRFLMGEWATFYENTAIIDDILPLAWMLAKYIITPKKSTDMVTSSEVAPRLWIYQNEAAIPGALRIVTAIITRHPLSPVTQRALTIPEGWLKVIVTIPRFLKVSNDTLILSWKALLAYTRKQLLHRGFVFSESFNNSLRKVYPHLNPVEWERLLSKPLSAPTGLITEFLTAKPKPNSSTVPQLPPPTKQYQHQHQQQVLNGSPLFSGIGASGALSTSYYTNSSSSSTSKATSSNHTTPKPGQNLNNLPHTFSAPRALPGSMTMPLKKKKVAVLEEGVPQGLSLQERKEQDAELQRQQLAKRKRDAMIVAEVVDAPLNIVTHSALTKGRNAQDRKTEAHARARRERLKSMDELYDKVLALSFNTLAFNSDLLSSAGMVPNTFVDVDEYVNVFEPLLLMELQTQLQTAKEELLSNVTTRNILYLSEFGQCHEATIKRDEGWQNNQVFLMWPKGKSSDLRSELNQLQKDASIFPHCLGIFTKDKKKKKNVMTIESAVASNENIVVRVALTGAKDHRSGLFSKLSIGSEWNFCPLYSLTTVMREWQALQCVDSLHGINEILRPSISDYAGSGFFHPAQIKELIPRLNDQRLFNQSQRRAVERSLSTTGFSYIQGPPGTGKTRTLVGMLSMIYALQGAPILVCTPSNSAIDEVIERILSKGLYDMSSSNPEAFTNRFNLVRIGHHASTPDVVKKVTLSDMVKKMAFEKRGTPIETIENSILKGADIVCCTLSSSGSSPLVRANIAFKTVIIDEAAQAVELATLIPLQHQCEKCILIGDPQQLPATVFSSMATQYLYERSLFARCSTTMRSERILLLNTQYRMHPQISLFPNSHFYKGQLIDGIQPKDPVWSTTSAVFSPLRFFDLKHSKNTGGTKSLGNMDEANFIIAMIYKLVSSNSSVLFADKIVVITPYQLQRNMLQTAFQREASNLSVFGYIEVCTVDSYQGKEKAIVIFSTVRAKRGQSIGFLADVRRMNVALTRAKQSLWVIGQMATLQVNPEWKALIKSMEDRDLLSIVDKSASDWWQAQ
jgi:hypothetical protein